MTFWKKEIKFNRLNLLGLLLLAFILSGFASGFFMNFVFPQLADFPLFARLVPRFTVVINKTEEIHVDDGVNLTKLYGNLRASTMTVISAEGGINPFEKSF
ncbi:MAG: hypothetical protein AAB871_01480, partial [Patescibacteria group bacterium]